MLNGIILAGGLSSRFGSCKSQLKLAEKSILDRTFRLMSKYCNQVAISCKAEKNFANYPCIFDKFDCHAPISGIYSSLEYFKSPVLVLSCDLPFIDDASLTNLISARNQAVLTQNDLQMTTFQIKDTVFIEALVAIYEQNALLPLGQALAEKNYSLFKVIKAQNRHHIITANKKPFFNINYQKDLEEAEELQNKSSNFN